MDRHDDDDDQHPNASRTVSAEPQASLAADLINVIRGFCMGAADTVPGVSGGTIALILGHYERLVAAISHFDLTALTQLRQGRFNEAARHVDLRFLAALAAGIGAGIVTLAGLMHWLLDYHMPETFAVFFGLLLASVWIVTTYIERWSPSRWSACGAGMVVALVICALPTGTGSSSLPYLFFCGAVAICAMILPGISGAFVLLLLGVYHQITGVIKDAVKGDFGIDALTQVVAFAIGCLFGLFAFTKLLRWLLEHYRDTTMAALMGLMIGSVAKLWPLQVPTPQTAALELKYRELHYVSPTQWPGSLLSLGLLAIAAAGIVTAIEWIATGRKHNPGK